MGTPFSITGSSRVPGGQRRDCDCETHCRCTSLRSPRNTSRRVPGRRQVQRDQLGHAQVGRRQVGVEVDAVQVHHVDRLRRQHLLDGALLPGPELAALRRRERLGGRARRNQRAAHPRSGVGDHQRPVAGFDQRGVQLPEHLLRATDGVGADRRERVGDAEDGEAHSGPSSASAAIASAARARNRAPSRPHACASYSSGPAWGGRVKS